MRYWDDTSKAPFLYNAEKRIFISYEDEQSIGLKGSYVKDRDLAGIMFWEYNGDFEGKLLNAINRAAAIAVAASQVWSDQPFRSSAGYAAKR